MGEQKDSVVVGDGGAASGGVGLSSKFRHRFRNKRQRRQTLIVTILTGCAAVGIVGFGMWRHADNQRKVDTAYTASQQALRDAKPQGAVEEAQAKAAQQKPEQANELLDDALRAAGTDAEKKGLLLAKAVIALNAKQYQEAITLAKQAEALSPGRDVSDVIAMAAEEKGDKALAVTYYKKILTQIDKSDPLYDSQVRRTQDKIKQLES